MRGMFNMQAAFSVTVKGRCWFPSGTLNFTRTRGFGSTQTVSPCPSRSGYSSSCNPNSGDALAFQAWRRSGMPDLMILEHWLSR